MSLNWGGCEYTQGSDQALENHVQDSDVNDRFISISVLLIPNRVDDHTHVVFPQEKYRYKYVGIDHRTRPIWYRTEIRGHCVILVMDPTLIELYWMNEWLENWESEKGWVLQILQ